MIRCAQCGHDNLEGELICANCHHPLVEVANGATRHLENVERLGKYPYWGTAQLGSERKLLLHIQNVEQPLIVPLNHQVVLGRFDVDTGQSPDVDLAGYGAQELGVSRRHAAITVEDETIKVMDLGSANSTYMNGQKLIANQPRILRDGDELRLGRMVMRVNFV